MRINYFFHVQRKLFLENEYKDRIENKENNVDFGIKTFVPDTLIGSYAYWKKVKDQEFYLALILGAPKIFVTITFNPKSNEVIVLSGNQNNMNNSPLVSRLFNQKKNCLIDYIKNSKLLGNVEGILWRIEYQQRGYPYCHILIWSDFDTDDLSKVDSVITCKLPEYDPYIYNNEKWKSLHALSSKYMTHKCTTRCKGEYMKNRKEKNRGC